MIYLYIKQHTITGLKYFGKTERKDPYVYSGSGKYWKRHLKMYGKQISTLQVWEFDNIEECEVFALNFSKKNNIIESAEWANLKYENGKDGNPKGWQGMIGSKNPLYGQTEELNNFYGRKHSQETIQLYKEQKAGGNNPRAKKITTPRGQFTTVKEAGKVLKMHLSTLRRMLNNSENGYHWGWK